MPACQKPTAQKKGRPPGRPCQNLMKSCLLHNHELAVAYFRLALEAVAVPARGQTFTNYAHQLVIDMRRASCPIPMPKTDLQLNKP